MRHSYLFPTLLVVVPGWADVVSYEATSTFPDEAGWVRSVDCLPDRWLEDGWLHQVVQAGECWEPPGGDKDTYTRSITEFDGAETFFVEWRLFADGDSSEFIWGAPAVLSAWNQGGEGYWFAIARDQVKFVQDDFTVILFVDILPGPHTHRLEVYSDQAYFWFIDGELIHAGTPGGPYPSANPSISWRAKSGFLESHVQWDYVRYGDIPIPASGDLGQNGQVDQEDLYFFEECVTTPAGGWPGCAWADMDSDGDTDCDDWELFQSAWTGLDDPPPLSACDCLPDLNGSGTVEAADLAQLLGGWGSNPGHVADLNADGLVNAADLALLLGAWGACP